MATYVFDRIVETTTTTGTGTLALDGATPKLTPFADAVGDRNRVPYLLIHRNGTEWEAGNGTLLLRPVRLERTEVVASSNSNSLVDLSAGTKDVWLSTPGDMVAFLSAASRTWTAEQVFQSPNPGGIVASITPNPTADTQSLPFNFVGGSSANSASDHKNFVVRLGFNIANGGGLETAGQAAMAEEFEGFYESSTGVYVFEQHLANVLSDGVSLRRPWSWLIYQDGTHTEVSYHADKYSFFGRTSNQCTVLLAEAASAAWAFNTGTVLRKEVNGETFLKQLNAAGSTYIDLLYLDSANRAVLTTLATVTLGDSQNIVVNTSTGTKIGTATGQKLAFWNATPVIQPASANQAALSLDVDVAGSDTVDKAAINSNFAALQTLVNQLRSDLVSAGLIKGAA